MAIKQSVESQFGTSHPEAYIRILSVACNYTTDEAQIYLGVYATEASRKADKQPLATPTLRCKAAELVNEDIRTAAYNWIKIQDAFKNSTDC